MELKQAEYFDRYFDCFFITYILNWENGAQPPRTPDSQVYGNRILDTLQTAHTFFNKQLNFYPALKVA